MSNRFFITSKGVDEGEIPWLAIVLTIIALGGVSFMFVYTREMFYTWLPFWVISFFLGFLKE